MVNRLGFESSWEREVSAIFEEYRKGFPEMMKEPLQEAQAKV